MSKVYVIHENSEWTVHLTKRLEELHIPFEEWDLSEGNFDLSEAPPEGIFYSRMSASSHTRGHRYAAEYTGAILEWLESYGRTVVNGTGALRLEVSKASQYAALFKHGIQTPKTLVATGSEQIIQAAKKLGDPSFITKHNRAGKGLGVRLFHSIEELERYVYGPEFEEPVDGITLIQQYIESPDQSITRCEFVGGKFVYAVKVDTAGGFELCPADACQINDLFCPVGEQVEEKPSFSIQKDFHEPIIEKYEQFLQAQGIFVAGIEFMKDKNGTLYTYDINTNTNYNADAEKEAGIFGMLQLAQYLQGLLERQSGVAN
ncbi:alpha-L-glutamate ligase [Niallia taxi]|uniref:ATP-grasp domain-containing protein n=1 Tax=Niallia taxi TaxID=2499688 RepID=UPI0015F43206|nr:alpha-L-glutamate ligase [Niallia taxi]